MFVVKFLNAYFMPRQSHALPFRKYTGMCVYMYLNIFNVTTYIQLAPSNTLALLWRKQTQLLNVSVMKWVFFNTTHIIFKWTRTKKAWNWQKEKYRINLLVNFKMYSSLRNSLIDFNVLVQFRIGEFS